MGKKKRHLVALKPFCYYCDKEFNNEIILHQHQKARHFNCKECKKRFSTAPALDTHSLQVHKVKLSRVPNAKSGRDLFDISIYGMDGVPIELVNFKLAEKVARKKRKLIQEKKIIADEEDLKEERNKKKRKQNEIDIQTMINTGAGFYHNPDSINLTLKHNQMNQMYSTHQLGHMAFPGQFPYPQLHNQIPPLQSQVQPQDQIPISISMPMPIPMPIPMPMTMPMPMPMPMTMGNPMSMQSEMLMSIGMNVSRSMSNQIPFEDINEHNIINKGNQEMTNTIIHKRE